MLVCNKQLTFTVFNFFSFIENTTLRNNPNIEREIMTTIGRCEIINHNTDRGLSAVGKVWKRTEGEAKCL